MKILFFHIVRGSSRFLDKRCARIKHFGVMFAAAVVALGISKVCAVDTTTSGDLRMEVITAYNFVVDSNVESPSTNGPSAAHLGVKIYNDGDNPLTDVYVNIGDLTTPGTFPPRTVTVGGANGYSGTFALQMPGGAADAVRYIPSIPAHSYVAQYFFVTYPLKDPAGNSVAGAAPDPNDDLYLNYSIWVSATDASTPLSVDKTTKVTMRNEISAMANKIWPNTDGKVPDAYLDAIQEQLGWRPDVATPRIPGAVVMEGIWYDLGNVGAGFDNNGDGIPDRNAWLQPVGNPAKFSPLAARLVKCYGLVIVKLNDGTEQLIPFEDRLYFENIPGNNRGAVGLVYYEFIPLDTSKPTLLSPYQEVASGYDNEKFNGDYGASVGSVAGTPPNVVFDKYGPATIAPGTNSYATYILSATSYETVGSNRNFGWPELALPLVFQDTIPSGLVYREGSATAANTPSGAFTVTWSTDGGTTWVTTEPAAASVKAIRWTMSGTLAPGQTAAVQFQANVPTSYPTTSVSNTGCLKKGTVETFACDTTTTLITGNNSIGDFIWRDLNRNGLPDDGATGIADITVSLYVDSNGNGTLDTGEPLYTSTSTNASGAYLFSSLPDRKYIVIVDSVDPQVPYGFTLKQGVSDRFAVNLDSESTNPNPVDFLTADWPFIQGLDITKSVTPTTYNEGALVSYTIDLDNNMSTLQVPAPALQTAYVTTATQTQNADGAGVTNDVTGAPNGSYGFMDWKANSDVITSTGLATFPVKTGTITKVELVVRGYMSRRLVNDTLEVRIGHTAVAPATFTILTTDQLNATTGVPQDIVINITSKVTGTWTWDQAQSLRVELDAKKVNNGDTGDYYIDSIGFRVTTSDIPFTGTYGTNTILDFPLKDTYDPAKLQYVSASTAPDRTTPAGTLEWDNLGPLNPGARKSLTLTFRALAPTDTNSDGHRDAMTATNTATTQGVSTGVVPRFVSGLPAGHDTSAVVVTINPTGTLGDLVYWDVDASGGFNTGDVRLKGVTVLLYQNPGSGFVFTGRTAFTDINGYYEFTGLADGTYRAQIAIDPLNDLFTLPWTSFTSTAIPTGGSADATYVWGASVAINNSNTSLADDSNLLQDFGFDTTSSMISGKLFMDYNANGIQDSGEEALAGYTMNLTGGTTASVVTDSNGFYRFSNITVTGNHTVTVAAPPAGTTQTLDPDATLNSNTVVNVAAGTAYTDRNFAYRPSGSLTIGDTVYYDWNGNGSQGTGELGIPNITVRLYEDANGDGLINLSEDAIIATQVTGTGATDVDGDSVIDPIGFYRFRNLAAGNYIVAIDTADPDFPAQHMATQDYDGILDNKAKVSLTTSSLTTVDFGYQPYGTGTIGNLVWFDANNNGIKDSGESAINGVTVELYRSTQTLGTDTPYATTTTAGGGLYSFTSLPATDWKVYIPAANCCGPN